MKRTWTIIGVGDVPDSFKWYQALFGQPATLPAHDYFGQILDSDGTVLPAPSLLCQRGSRRVSLICRGAGLQRRTSALTTATPPSLQHRFDSSHSFRQDHLRPL